MYKLSSLSNLAFPCGDWLSFWYILRHLLKTFWALLLAHGFVIVWGSIAHGLVPFGTLTLLLNPRPVSITLGLCVFTAHSLCAFSPRPAYSLYSCCRWPPVQQPYHICAHGPICFSAAYNTHSWLVVWSLLTYANGLSRLHLLYASCYVKIWQLNICANNLNLVAVWAFIN